MRPDAIRNVRRSELARRSENKLSLLTATHRGAAWNSAGSSTIVKCCCQCEPKAGTSSQKPNEINRFEGIKPDAFQGSARSYGTLRIWQSNDKSLSSDSIDSSRSNFTRRSLHGALDHHGRY